MANATHNNKPSCVICAGLDPRSTQIAAAPDMSERRAKCCDEESVVPSSKSLDGSLAFFEYRGPGSRLATEQCVCGYYESAHRYDESRVSKEPVKCATGFIPHGPYEFDSYYCGHGGWD